MIFHLREQLNSETFHGLIRSTDVANIWEQFVYLIKTSMVNWSLDHTVLFRPMCV